MPCIFKAFGRYSFYSHSMVPMVISFIFLRKIRIKKYGCYYRPNKQSDDLEPVPEGHQVLVSYYGHQDLQMDHPE
jgi:hypothetical protein